MRGTGGAVSGGCALVHLPAFGRIVRRAYQLIRPPTRRFDFTYLHGIAWQHVARAPSFAEAWPLIAAMCDRVDFVAAHNATFYQSVLRACCARARPAIPAHRFPPFECTVKLARRELGIYPTKLHMVAERLGIALDHHNAASDAEACAAIVLRTWQQKAPSRIARAV